MSDELTSLYPTTLLRRHLPEMTQTNQELAGLITQMAATGPNMTAGTSTQGGSRHARTCSRTIIPLPGTPPSSP